MQATAPFIFNCNNSAPLPICIVTTLQQCQVAQTFLSFRRSSRWEPKTSRKKICFSLA